jgi:hypothetical protein
MATSGSEEPPSLRSATDNVPQKGRGTNGSGARRCGGGWSLCHSISASSESASCRNVRRADSDEEIASRAGADEVLLTGENLVERIRALAPDGVHHVVEVAFGANIKTDMEALAQGGSIATYATNTPTPEIPFWELVFVNARIFFVGSDDVPADAKMEATRAINQALEAGWQGAGHRRYCAAGSDCACP